MILHNAINADRMNRIWRSREITRKTRTKIYKLMINLFSQTDRNAGQWKSKTRKEFQGLSRLHKIINGYNTWAPHQI